MADMPKWFDETYYLNAKLAQMQESDPEYTMAQLEAAFKDAGLTAYEHYEAYGDSEGLSPNPNFDRSYYMAAKLAQMQKTDPEYTMDQLEAAFKDAGLTAYEHYDAYGDAEGLSPNQYFDRDFYMAAKLAQMQASDPEYTMDQLEAALKDAGLTAYEHYNTYGANEGLNPSQSFDEAKYMAAKLAEMQKADPEYTMAQLEAAFAEAGLSPLEHYLTYGKDEGLTPAPVTKDWALTTDVDKIAGAADDDVITGVASALVKEATLNAGDQIDGGAGNDTLDITMNGNFTGFTGEGFMKNVENVNLTNEGTIARTFTAKGVEGVEVYNVKGAVDLAGITADAAVNLSDRASGSATIAYASKATDGTDDTLALGLNAMGTAEVKDADGKITTAQKAVTVNAVGIENLNVTATGTNVVDLSGVAAAKAVTIAGEGDLKVTALADTVKTVDASELIGDLDINMASTEKVTSVASGAGDDVIRASAGNLAADAAIDGGEGKDKLVLTGTLGSSQYEMSNVENVEFSGATANFSAKYASGLENIVVKGTSDIKIADMDDLNLTLSGAGTGTVVSDHDGNTVMTVTGGTKGTTFVNDTDTAFSDSSSVELTVDQYNILTGEISAAKAASFVANVASDMGIMDASNNTITNAIITLKEATSAVFTVNNDKANSHVILNADKLLDLQVTTDGNFALAGTLGEVQSLTIDTDGAFSAAETGSAVVFGKVAEVNLSGAGSVKLDTLGATTGNDYGITVNASGLDDLTIDSILSASTADVDVSAVKGDVTIGTITAATNSGSAGISGETVTFTGSHYAANNAYINATSSATITGGIDNDTFMIVSDVKAGKTATFDLTGGLGEDKFMIDYTQTLKGKAIVTINDFTAGDDTTNINSNTLEAFTGSDGSVFNAVMASQFLSDVLGTTISTDAVKAVEGFENKAFTYAGDTYLVVGASANPQVDASFDDGEIAVKLAGTFTADELTDAF